MSSGDKKRNRGDRPELLPGEVHEEAGPFPDNIQEMWDACIPKFTRPSVIPLITGTGGEIPNNSLNELFYGKTQEEKDQDEQQ